MKSSSLSDSVELRSLPLRQSSPSCYHSLMRKLKYCTCGKDNQSKFSNLFLGIGIIVHLVLLIGALSMQLGFFLLAAGLIAADIWQYSRYYKQARRLKHSEKCARRYAVLASLAQNKALSDGYSDYK